MANMGSMGRMDNTTSLIQKENTPPAIIIRERRNDDDVIDLVELFFAILNKWYFVLLALIIGAVAGFFTYRFTVIPQYQADAEVYITTTDKFIDMSALNISEHLATDYTEFFMSRSVLKKTISELGLNMTHEQLAKKVSIKNPDGSHILKIYVTMNNSEDAIQICNSLVRNGINEIFRITSGNEPSVIDFSESDSIKVIVESRNKYILIGGLLGAMLVCGLIVLRFLTDTTIKSDEDIEKNLGLSALTYIPDFTSALKKEEKRKKNVIILPDASDENDSTVKLKFPSLDFMTQEAINKLRGNILVKSEKTDAKAIAFTSTVASEGKSSISLLTAKSFADIKRKTVFIDCDIRNSKIRETCGVTKTVVGLSEFLGGKATAEDIVYSTDNEYLDIIFAGENVTNPSELLSGEAFGKLIESLKSRFDCIIVDTPPVDIVIDGVMAGKSCDATIFVVVGRETEKQAATNVKKQLESAGINIMGVVMNKTEYGMLYYGRYSIKRYGYGKYGKYGYGKYGRYGKYGYYGNLVDEKNKVGQRVNS